MIGENRYFGTRHDAPRYEEAARVDPPVGWAFLFCEEPIEAGDDGWIMGHVGLFDGKPVCKEAAVHRECELLHVLGHSYGVCHCHDDEFAGWTERERATELLRRIEGGRSA